MKKKRLPPRRSKPKPKPKPKLKSEPRSGAKPPSKPKAKSRARSTFRAGAKSGPSFQAGAGPSAVERLLETGGTVTRDMQVVRFAGVALGGGKTDKTAVAVLEYYPDQRRVFLRSLRDKVSVRGEMTADEVLYEVLTEDEKDLSVIAFDAPLQLPQCIRCQMLCPGVQECPDAEVKWMRELHRKRDKTKRPNKMFTPYTERAIEIYIANELEEPFHPSHALGANAAPLTARAHFFKQRLRVPLIEVYPKLSLWRVGMNLAMPKSHLRFHRHAIGSDESRLYILKTLIEKEIAFIYQQDLRTMVENNVAFEAFISALTAFLKFRGQTERRPPTFPKEALWIDFPKQKIQWF